MTIIYHYYSTWKIILWSEREKFGPMGYVVLAMYPATLKMLPERGHVCLSLIFKVKGLEQINEIQL